MKTKVLIIFFIMLFILLIMTYKIFIRKNKTEVSIVIFIFLALYFFYSFFTTAGSTRLSIALYGHPLIAYTTKLEYKHNFLSKTEYVSLKRHMDDYSGNFLCKRYGLIKITTYYGFM